MGKPKFDLAPLEILCKGCGNGLTIHRRYVEREPNTPKPCPICGTVVIEHDSGKRTDSNTGKSYTVSYREEYFLIKPNGRKARNHQVAIDGGSAMSWEEVESHIEAAVRECVPPNCAITFSSQVTRLREVTINLVIKALIKTDSLIYAKDVLLNLINGELIESDSQEATITGVIGSKEYKLQLIADGHLPESGE